MTLVPIPFLMRPALCQHIWIKVHGLEPPVTHKDHKGNEFTTDYVFYRCALCLNWPLFPKVIILQKCYLSSYVRWKLMKPLMFFEIATRNLRQFNPLIQKFWVYLWKKPSAIKLLSETLNVLIEHTHTVYNLYFDRTDLQLQ